MCEGLTEDLQEIRKRLNQQTQKMTQKPAMTFWSIEGAFIRGHHVEPRVQLSVPKEETFPIP